MKVYEERQGILYFNCYCPNEKENIDDTIP